MSFFYVHSETGCDTHMHGASPQDPLASLEYALRLTKHDGNDVVVVLPGHRETLIGGLTLSAGVDLRTIGQVQCEGKMQSTFVFEVPK